MSPLHQILASSNPSETLQTLCRAARAIGRDVRIEPVYSMSNCYQRWVGTLHE